MERGTRKSGWSFWSVAALAMFSIFHFPLSIFNSEFQNPNSEFPTPQAEVLFYPHHLIVYRDSTGFVQQMIEFREKWYDSIEVTGIHGSCECATASVQRPIAYDTVKGKIFLQINAKHFKDTVNYVDYTITTIPETKTVYRVIVVTDSNTIVEDVPAHR